MTRETSGGESWSLPEGGAAPAGKAEQRCPKRTSENPPGFDVIPSSISPGKLQ